jgi:chromosome segregation ATPase
MWKKLVIAAAAVLIGLAFVKGTGICSYLRTWKHQAANWVKHQVKIETEIQRLRQEVERLERDDRVTLDVVARQRLDVQNAQNRLSKDRAEQTRLHDRISQLRASLKNVDPDVQQVSYNGSTYARAEAEKQLDVDFQRYKPLKGSVSAQEKGLTALQTALSQNEQKLFSGKQRRQEMFTTLQELENELTELRQAQSTSATVVDDSNYGRVQRDIQALKNRLAVEKEKLKIEGTLGGGPIEQAEAEKSRKAAREKDLDTEFGAGPARERAVDKLIK